MSRKTLLVILLASLIAMASVATYIIISNRVHREAQVERINGIQITITGFPETVDIGKNYTFTVDTENVLDQELEDLTTYMTIAFNDSDGNPVVLDPEYITVWWHFVSVENEPEGYIPYDGILPFTWDDSMQALVRTHEGWSAPVGFHEVAEITFRINANAPLNDGTLITEAWVEYPQIE